MTQTFNDVSKSTERIFKNGNSQAMSLSKKTIQSVDFEIGDTVEVQKINDGLFITKKEVSIEDSIKNFFQNGGKYQESEVEFGESVGREI
ncbi:AbrB family transcriptional regulator [Staphylococcus pseudintermedius]|uniref:AbrB/MazE/SpoVT family DNA-binding domain-containing protein n=1 Tax=Staphylococcus pseudintermedius TaxID=283734 RepID=UPI00165532FD|nr:AbrB family transcriptional regulator [Staphylococcus pseudintermedius]MBC8683424.1 AbrB family transcriptional regulator [Staphylococcus pseudintermedius]